LNSYKKNILVFDFDGVVCDSTYECLVTSWNAWQSFTKQDKYRYKVSEFTLEEIDYFKAFRYYVKGAGEYFTLRKIISDNKTSHIKSFEDFNSLGATWEEQIKEFKPHMFSSRKILRDRSLENWINLHKVYPEVTQIITKSIKEKNIYLATLKDLESVQLILSNEGIEFPSERIFHQGLISTKLEALIQIQKIEKINPSNILFFDDVVSHLLDPFELGFQTYQTSWGNVPKDYIIEAERRKIPLAELASLPSLCSIN
tara:strand:+ start:932 stop:1702 length:771 start_codon:yes stop_codon:yes gene_type:complete